LLHKVLGDWLKSSLYHWFSGSLPIFRGIAFYLIDKGRFAEAETLLKGLVYWSPDDAEAQEKLGWALLKQEKALEGVDAFTKAIELNEEWASTYQGLGEAHKHLGENRKAAKALQRALELKPDAPPSCCSMELFCVTWMT
jgi:tetratricopeptide (TPR) repeat protein